jgi:acyl carrier protein
MTRPTTPAPAVAAPAGGAWLQVFAEGQQQTMEAHLAFQKALADAHAAYLQAFESTSQGLVQALAGRPLPAPGAAITAPVMPAPAVAPVAAPVVTATAIVAPVMPVKPAAPAPAPAPRTVAAPAPAPAPQVVPAAPKASGVDARTALLAVVADKTGYPASALDDAMHLESDLGIDSIKRVEILGALKEKVPAAASLDALKLAQLATLGEIAAALAAVAGSAPAAAPAAAPKAAAPAAAPKAAGVDARGALLAVVADKTGYPASALDDGMHLESDLGIDSIKRVEILGALKEKVPAAASLDALKLAQLATLGEIAAALAAVAGSAPAAAGRRAEGRCTGRCPAPVACGRRRPRRPAGRRRRQDRLPGLGPRRRHAPRERPRDRFHQARRDPRRAQGAGPGRRVPRRAQARPARHPRRDRRRPAERRRQRAPAAARSRCTGRCPEGCACLQWRRRPRRAPRRRGREDRLPGLGPRRRHAPRERPRD